MITIIESGSTKADWLIIDEDKRFQHHTIGFNPFFHSSEFVRRNLENDSFLANWFSKSGEIYFYGAGCSSTELQEIIKTGIKSVFKNAVVEVDHDLSAAGLSVYRGNDVIACIIGTGSNSVLFDGTKHTEVVPALGYILGDEGSGSFFGKQMLTDFLYNRLPEKMDSDIRKLELNKDTIFRKVYMEPNANVFLASLSPIIIANKDLEYSKKLIQKGFDLFLENHVCCYSNYKEVEVSFVGSISALLSDELSQACERKGIKLGQIIRRPIEALASYHLNQVSKKN
ncbi:MAG: N-acetylglucosamine kinase [Bacteroidota bacterium]